MGTELAGPCIKDENMDIPAIPPGFESLASFALTRVENNETAASSLDYASASSMHTMQVETEFECSDDTKIMRSLRCRPGINYSGCDDSSGDESDCEQNPVCKPRLPKGVIRGCEKCSNCQKVVARWRPEEGCRADLQEAPIFYPTEEEFKDTLKYIASIQLEAEAYGICRIVPPPSWKPPCPLKEKNIWEHSKFITRIQRIDKLQNRDSVGKLLKNNNHRSKKRRKCTKTGVDHETREANKSCPGEAGIFEAERFGFEPGPVFTLEAFQNYANDFKAQYFRKTENTANPEGNTWGPSLENIESEYWRMVEKPTEEIEVLYGADLETGEFGSGFPKIPINGGSTSDEKYVKSGWNLNKFPRLMGSVLSYESSDISGVLVPWLYIGMCFSSFCWHVEDHHLYSMNYMHWGAPKMWYGVPGADALKLEAAMRKHLPDLFEEQPDLLHKLVTQLSPSILKAEGVPVHRCVQNPGEFVLTFPRAYHSGFNCGFNCAEAVNVAPVDWLPHGQNAIELYREQGRKTSVSHDKLLLGAARDAVKAHWELNLLRKNTPDNLRWKSVCGKDGILSKALKTRVEMEHLRREFLCNSSQALKMESNFDANCERECSVCLFDLHLSAAGCHYCSPDKYACLNHVKQLCLCSWGAKFFLFRYDMNELNILVEALEGKLSAIYRWARLDLGLALTSYVSKENLQVPAFVGRLPYVQEGTHLKEKRSLPFIPFLKEQKGKEEAQNSDEVVNKACLPQKEKPSGELLTLGNKKYVSTLVDQCKKERSTHVGSTLVNPAIQLSQRDMKNMDSMTAEKPEMKNSPFPGSGDVILLSDDEGEESSIAVPGRTKDNNAMDTGSSQRLVVPSGTSNSGNCTQNPILPNPMTNASMMVAVGANSSPDGETIIHAPISECEKGKDYEKRETLHCSNSQNLSCPEVISSPDFDKNLHGISHTKESSGCNVGSTVTNFQLPLLCGNGNPNDEEMDKRMGSDVISKSADEVKTGSCNQSTIQNNLDRYFRQKGPRIARVVRRINCNIEPLEFGIIHPGKCWCDSRAIYPKGFRSRVRHMSVLDPTTMCHYISEILDAGLDEPLFMVSLEQCPSEVFVHVSAARCWEMVRERLNQEITKQHKLGRMKLPPLQPPGSIDGMEMFGFSSPAIVQVIQEMDCGRVCTEYWKSRPLMKIPQHPLSNDSVNLCTKLEVPNNQEESKSYSLPAGVDTIVAGLFKKANPEELRALYTILGDNNSADQGLVTRLLNKEINRRPR